MNRAGSAPAAVVVSGKAPRGTSREAEVAGTTGVEENARSVGANVLDAGVADADTADVALDVAVTDTADVALDVAVADSADSADIVDVIDGDVAVAGMRDADAVLEDDPSI